MSVVIEICQKIMALVNFQPESPATFGVTIQGAAITAAGEPKLIKLSDVYNGNIPESAVNQIWYRNDVVIREFGDAIIVSESSNTNIDFDNIETGSPYANGVYTGHTVRSPLTSGSNTFKTLIIVTGALFS